MARYHASGVPALKSWDEVDEALRQIALEELAISEIEGEMHRRTDEIKGAAKEQSTPHRDRIERLRHDIEEYGTANKSEFAKVRTKTLVFGECGFRRSTTISIPTAKERFEAVIRNILHRQMDDCVVTTQKVDREALKKYGKDAVTEVGGTWKEHDTFWCEPTRETLDGQQDSHS